MATGYRSGNAPGPGEILQLVRGGAGLTRAELMARTGLSRPTMAQRLDQLLAHRFIYDAGGTASTGGRPPSSFSFNPDAGLVLSAGIGATHCRIGVTNLAGAVLAEHASDIDITEGPERTLPWIEEQFRELVHETGRDAGEVLAVGVGLPAPVEHATGKPVNPPIMPGWDGYPVAQRLAEAFPVPVLVDNDTNSMAWGEHWMHYRDIGHLLFIKVGYGIGCGIVADGHIQRGADGAAGDIGHLPIPAAEGIRCKCGNLGCLETVASGRAMADRLDVKDSRAVVALARGGAPEAMDLVRQSGRHIGEALVSAVNLLNPRVIVVGGDVAHADHLLLAGIREVLYQRSLPLATRHLRIVRSQLDDRAGLIGASIMAIEHVLAPDVIDRVLRADEGQSLPSRAAS
jgi:predicted NBD/HSP70 family sugar kinase